MLYTKTSRASTPNMAFFLVNVENNFCLTNFFKPKHLKMRKTFFGNSFMPKQSVFIIISMMYDPAYEREMINGKKSKQQW